MPRFNPIFFIPVQLQIEEISRKLRTGELGIAPVEERFELLLKHFLFVLKNSLFLFPFRAISGRREFQMPKVYSNRRKPKMGLSTQFPYFKENLLLFRSIAASIEFELS